MQPSSTAARTLLVTGGGRGIGAAIVRGAARAGYAVAFSYLQDEAAAAALTAELAQAGTRAVAIRGDVADPAFAPRLFDEAEAALGPVAALVNNAGVTGHIGPLADTPIEVVQRVVEVNLMGALYVGREAVRRWLASGAPGRMVNISSVAAALGAPGEYVHYAAAKAGVEAFTVGLGKEVAARGIRVNAVSPGTTQTEIHARAGQPDRPARVAAKTPMGRVAEPEEVAEAVLWLLSDQASYVTGTVLRVAGGA